MKMKKVIVILESLCLSSFLQAQTPQTTNKPDRVNWFQDLGFGMFIPCNVD
jgi:alpha-L-fucosidase